MNCVFTMERTIIYYIYKEVYKIFLSFFGQEEVYKLDLICIYSNSKVLYIRINVFGSANTLQSLPQHFCFYT